MEAIVKPEPALITVAQAAKLANVAPVTVYRRIHSGEIAAVKVGEGRGPIRIERESFVAWLYGEAE